MLNDSMFFTNGVDPVFKYDGRNYMRAGLPRFNPYLFVSKNTSTGTTAKISFPTVTATVPSTVKWGAADGYYGAFYTTPGGTAGFAVGDKVKLGTSVSYANIASITAAGTVAGTASGVNVPVSIINFDSPIFDAASGTTLSIASVEYKYYFRYNLIDSNNNRIVSATLGSQDVVVVLNTDTRVEFRLLPLPIFGQFDYAKLEVEVYRTKKNESAPYRRISNIEVPYPILDYIDVYDSTVDALLTDLDYTTSVTEGQELLLGNSLPPVARCITTANNRLLLGATTSTPSVSLTWTSGASAVSYLDFDSLGIKLTINGNPYRFYCTAAYSDTALTKSISGITYDSGTNIASITYANGAFDADVGQWVYMNKEPASGVVVQTNLRYMGWFKVLDKTIGATSTTLTTTIGTPSTTPTYATAYDATADANRIYAVNVAAYKDCFPIFTDSDLAKQTKEGNVDAVISTPQKIAAAINAFATLAASGDMFWAEYGNDVSPGIGSMIIRTMSTSDSLQFFEIPGRPSVTLNAKVFANNRLIPSTAFLTTVTPAVSVFRGSRIVKSYKNHPENFDNPDGVDAGSSSSIIDVNPADGQTITAMIPLIGPSTSSSSQLQGTVIVFKERSIYAVDIEAGTFEKLETNGIGAPYPNSVAYTKSGLAFASESGLYRLDRSLKITKISGNVNRQWNNSDLLDTDNFHGHHLAKDSQYKLSTPENTVLVYNYEREIEGKPGAWCEYTNHPVAGGWANQGNYEFFASTLGRVFINRHTNTSTDYRDDSNDGIALDIKFRPMNFGDAAIRKQVRHVNVGFRNTAQLSDNIDVSCAFDCSTDFTSLDSFQTQVEANATISSIRFGIPTGRLTYLQLRIQSDTIDEPIEVAGVTYKVAGLQVAGTKEAKTSKGNS
jgi:hypothetical protein